MNLRTKLLTAALLLAGTQTALATDWGVKAGTQIDNKATVSFSVNGTPQTTPAEGEANFKVDRKVDLTVTASAGISVAPESTDQILTFTVQNKTNDTLDFTLAALQATGDEFDVSGLEIWVDSNGIAGLQMTDPDGGGVGVADTNLSDTAYYATPYLEDLVEDDTKTVYVVGDIPEAGTDPGEVANDDTSTIKLVAQAVAQDTGTTATAESLPATTATSPGAALAAANPTALDDPTVVDNVYVDVDGDGASTDDAAADGKHSDDATYTVGAATVAVTKTMTVICENWNAGTSSCTGNYSDAGKLKPLPGALIQYCILISNTGGQAASDVVISDPVDTTNLTWVADSMRVNTAATCDSADAATEYAAGDATYVDDDTTVDDPDAAGPLLSDEGKNTSPTFPGASATDGSDIGANFTAPDVNVSASSVAATSGKFAVMFRMIVK